MSVKDRIKIFANYHDINISTFEKSINASNGYVNSISKNIGLDKITKLLEIYPNLNLEWLVTGKGTMLKTGTSVNAEPISSNRKTADPIYELQRIPVFNLEATMGLLPLVNGNGIDEEKIIDYISIPSMPSCDGAIFATGDSMYPLLKSGDMIAYKRIELDRSKIFFGEIYVIAVKIDETETMKTIKYVQKSELGDDYIKLVSYNQHHDPKDIHLNQIAAIALVRGSIRIHN